MEVETVAMATQQLLLAELIWFLLGIYGLSALAENLWGSWLASGTKNQAIWSPEAPDLRVQYWS